MEPEEKDEPQPTPAEKITALYDIEEPEVSPVEKKLAEEKPTPAKAEPSSAEPAVETEEIPISEETASYARELGLSDKMIEKLATAGMLEGGPVLDYFKRMAADPNNMIAFVSYQIEGTLGSRILKNSKEISLMGSNGRMEIVKVGMRVEAI